MPARPLGCSAFSDEEETETIGYWMMSSRVQVVAARSLMKKRLKHGLGRRARAEAVSCSAFSDEEETETAQAGTTGRLTQALQRVL